MWVMPVMLGVTELNAPPRRFVPVVSCAGGSVVIMVVIMAVVRWWCTAVLSTSSPSGASPAPAPAVTASAANAHALARKTTVAAAGRAARQSGCTAGSTTRPATTPAHATIRFIPAITKKIVISTFFKILANLFLNNIC